MRTSERDKAIQLRLKDQLGYGVIAKRLGVPKSTLSYWLKDLPLSPQRILELRREAWGRGEASREAFRETMRKKREAREEKEYARICKKLEALSHQSLFVAGLMLYLAEGDKKDRYHVGLANTDPDIIAFFIWWMNKYLHVQKKRVRAQLHLYESMDVESERMFWRKKTGLPATQFYKDQIRPMRPNSFSYRESFRHGTCKLYVQGTKEKTELTLSIRAFFDTYKGLRA